MPSTVLIAVMGGLLALVVSYVFLKVCKFEYLPSTFACKLAFLFVAIVWLVAVPICKQTNALAWMHQPQGLAVAKSEERFVTVWPGLLREASKKSVALAVPLQDDSLPPVRLFGSSFPDLGDTSKDAFASAEPDAKAVKPKLKMRKVAAKHRPHSKDKKHVQQVTAAIGGG
jgi:hypothetical protein